MQAFGPVKDSPARDPHPPAVPDQGLTVVPDDQVIRGNLDFDPTNSRIGDERYGHWENVPPFMGPRNGPPPPLTTEITKFPTDPASLAARTAPPTNFVTPGKSWIGETDPPFARYQRYRLPATPMFSATVLAFAWIHGRAAIGASICADPAAMAADNGSLPLTENCGNGVGICPAADFRIAPHWRRRVRRYRPATVRS
jgi:hypothetical protein